MHKMEVKKKKQMKHKFDKKHKKGCKQKQFQQKKVSKIDALKANINQLTQNYQNIDSKKLQRFSEYPLSAGTLKGLEEAGFDEPTEIQRESLGLALRGMDILGAAKTGSGKTLAFIIPIIEKLYTSQWSRLDGVGALVITPTRELAYQIFETLRVVGRFHDLSAGLVIGGKDLKFELNRLKSCNIIICTPGRLLQHLDENPSFSMDNLQILVLDEADRCLDLGFQQALNSIIEALPPKRQTLLFSATQTRCVSDLARLSLESPVYVSVHENSATSTPDNLTQSYIVTDIQNKINILWSFLKSHRKKKTLVFLQSCKQVKYLNEIFCRLRPGLSVMALYGTLHQLKRMAIYDQFCNKESAVMFATDIAARGLDFPAVDWVIQLDCPEDSTTYVHRVGRTARFTIGGSGRGDGESLLVLLPAEEEGMLKQLKANKIPVNKIEINPNKMFGIEKKMAAHLASDIQLKESAQRAFHAYIKSVYLMKNKTVFDAHKIDIDKFAESLGLAVAPRVRFLAKQKKLQEAQKTNKKNKEKEKAEANLANASNKVESEFEESDESEEEEEKKEEVTSPENKLKKEKKAKKISKEEVKTENEKLRFGDSDGESDDEIFTVKRKNVQIEGEVDAKNDSTEAPVTKAKGAGLSKVQLAKKMLKKQIVPNTKVTFDEDGDAQGDSHKSKVSEEGRKYEAEEGDHGGINIERAKAVMKAEDKFDKETERRRHKELRQEKKRKEKEARKRKREEADNDEEEEGGESDSGESVDLSWLPDPDQVYAEKNSDKESMDDEAGSSDSEEGMDTEVRDTATKVTVIKKRIPKRQKVEEEEEEKPELDTGLSLEDDEDLALQLLRR